MYRALYRKWRPSRFCDVVGQGCVTDILKSEVTFNKVGHAYLFIGSRGTGKTTCARIFSKAINCTNSDFSLRPCGTCEKCKLAEKEALQDVIELDAASNNGVNDIREICESTKFTPVSCKYKVYIIDEVHMLSTGAFNALLKTLEEPPDNVVFLLATTEVNKIPATILSRCQKFVFKKISIEEIVKRLLFVAENERINLDKKAAETIASCSDGAMRDALSILDKCASISGDVTDELVCRTLMIVDEEFVFKLFECLVNKDLNGAFFQLSIIESSASIPDLMSRLISMFRDLMLVKSLIDIKKFTSLNEKLIDKIKEISNKISLEEILMTLDTIQDCAQKLPYVPDVELQFKSTLIKICKGASFCGGTEKYSEEIISLANRVNALEREFEDIKKSGNILSKVSSEKLLEESFSNKENQQNRQDPKKSREDLFKNAKEMENWFEVLEILKGVSHTVYSAFKGTKAYISDNYVLIDSPTHLAFDLLKKSVQRDKIRDIIKKVTGRHYRLGPYKQPVVVNDGAGFDSAEALGFGSQGGTVDPLDVFIKRAKDLGINVNLKDGR